MTDSAKTKKQLIAELEALRHLIESAGEGISIVQDGVVKYANAKIAEITGYSREELKSTSPAQIIHPDDLDRVMSYIKQRMAGGNVPSAYTFRILDKKGAVKWLERVVSSITWEASPASLLFDQDITEQKWSQEILRESEDIFSSFLEHSPIYVFFKDENIRAIRLSNNYEKMLGRPLAELYGKSMDDLFPSEFARNMVADDMKILQEGKEITIEEELNGRYYSTVKFPIVIEGKPQYLAGYTIDITEQKQAKEALKESEQKYRLLADNSLTGVFIIQDDRLAYVNDTYARMHGYTAGEMLGMEIFKTAHPDSVEAMKESMKSRLSGISTSGTLVRHKLRKDGQSIWVESATAAVTYKGRPAIMGNVTDITERKKAEDDLCLKAQLLDNTSDLIFLHEFAPDPRIIYVNDTMCQSLGYRREELLNTDFHRLIAPEYSGNIARHQQKRIEGVSNTLESALIKKDGSLLPIEVRTRGITVGNKKLVLSNARDITARKQLEQEKSSMEHKAQVASRLASVGELAAGIAHEINNPLTGVIGFAELLASRQDLPEDIQKDLKTINSGAQRVASIVKRLLIFARQTKPLRDYINIHEIIQNTLELRAYHLRTGNIEVTTEFDPNMVITVADGGQLQQVFLNLIANAEVEMQQSHGKGRLLIKTEKKGKNILITFKDDGPGITKENLEKLFTPFFTTKEVGNGTGLGLSICYGIMAEHGGRIWAESQKGKGATFFVELPVIDKIQQIKLPEAEAAGAVNPEPARILVVDDEEVIRDFLRRVLTAEGHQVDLVDNGKEALEKIKKERYRLILLDMKMPGMDGIELYHNIKKVARSLVDRVVFVTGDVMAAGTQQFLEKTGATYITKPFDAVQLNRELRRLLRG